MLLLSIKAEKFENFAKSEYGIQYDIRMFESMKGAK